MVLRNIVRVPMGLFDEYRSLCFKYPRMMNFYMMNMGLIFILFVGKGVEKLSMRGPQNDYEAKRRLRRMFIPYSLCNYKWRFPENN